MAAKQALKLNSASLQVFEARFGDNNGAQALLEFPQQMQEFFLRLYNKADLPDSAPAGAVWEPFIRGWQEDGHYLIALTEEDRSAARPGMIATRMFAVPMEQAQCWDALDILFKLLRDTNRQYVPEREVPLPLSYVYPVVSPALLACVAHRLIHEDNSVAIIGQCEFDALIATFWRHLSTELRLIFSFGFSFTPVDLSVSRANIVAVPASCEARWSSYSFKCDCSWEHPLNDSTAAILGDARADGFQSFLNDVGLVVASFSDYSRYARLWSYWQRRLENDPEVPYALLRSLGTFLPSRNEATEYKREAVRIVAKSLKDASPEDILSLRSVKAGSFLSVADDLESAICDWLKFRFRSTTSDMGVGLARIVSSVSTCHSTEWQEWIRKGLKHAFVSLDEITAKSIWLICDDEAMLSVIGPEIPISQQTENILVRTFPETISSGLYTGLVKFCFGRDWISLMAKSALSYLGFIEAIQLIQNQISGDARISATKLLCAEADPLSVWASSFEYDDETLFQCAVEVARVNSILWTTGNREPGRWVRMLESAITGDQSLLDCADTDAIIRRLIDAWENGVAVTEVICEALEGSGRLSFINHPNRSRLWARIPQRFVSAALKNTLRLWLVDYYSKPSSRPELEQELVDIIFDPDLADDTFPHHSPMLAGNGIGIIEEWGSTAECEKWLNKLALSPVLLDQEVAKRAGDLVLNRGWGIVAKAAKTIDDRLGRRDFRLVWEIYYKSLSMFDRLTFDYFFINFPSVLDLTKAKPIIDMIKVVIVTALPEEFSAITDHLSNCEEFTENGTIYEVGLFQHQNISCAVTVVQTGMGNTLSAIETERALSHFEPQFAFFVGIAGGLRDDLNIGDVVAANKVYGYEGGKSGTIFQPRPDAPLISHKADQRANAVVRAKKWQKRIKSRRKSKPKAIVRPIAAGEKVLTSMTSEDMIRLKTTFTDAHAVAMEDLGFAMAVHKHPSVCFAVVRGISDLIEGKQAADKSGSHKIAAQNAAAFAFEMLAGLLLARPSST